MRTAWFLKAWKEDLISICSNHLKTGGGLITPMQTLPVAGVTTPNVYSSRIIEDGSYLRLKTVALGYTLPAPVLRRIKIKSIRLYAAAQNLVTWTNYTGVDPEVSVRNSPLTPSFDWSAYPKARTITVGLNVTF